MNPLDQKIRDSPLSANFNVSVNQPSILAFDVVGTVVANGPNSSLPIGTRVFAQSSMTDPASGGLQEYTVVDSRWAIPVPPHISDTDASTFPVNGMTVAVVLFSPAALGLPLPGTPEAKTFDYAAQSLVVVGAGTNNGKLAIQFARIAGIGTIVAVASLSSEKELKQYGATHIVDRKAEDINAEVRKIVGDDLIYAVDAYNGGPDLSLAVSLLSNSKKGTLVHLVPVGPGEEILRTKKAGCKATGVFGSSAAHPELATLFWKTFADWVESKQVQPTKYEVIDGLDAEKVNLVLDEMKGSSTRVKWAVKL